MTTPRNLHPPLWAKAGWAAGVLLGAIAIFFTGTSSQAQPRALSLATLSTYLARVAGSDAHDIRVNGVYGSAHDGAWQFVAHLTWRDTAGGIHGGTTDLPTLAGAATMPSEFGATRLTVEEGIGWPLPTLDAVLSHLQHTDAALALVDLEITAETATVTACTAGVDGQGGCRVLDEHGRVTRTYEDTFTDEPTAGPLAVQRADAPVLLSP